MMTEEAKQPSDQERVFTERQLRALLRSKVSRRRRQARLLRQR